ncbi:magnesium transporter [Candidatus Bathyarchaeota archaeon]|nr:MAG: magnesium transporter [Candidatus Bathyarchaeota archaeon]
MKKPIRKLPLTKEMLTTCLGDVLRLSGEDLAKIMDEAVKFVRRERMAVKSLLKKIKPKDFPLIIERLSKDESLQLILLLPDDVIKEFIAKLPAETTKELATSMNRSRFVKILSELPSDELSDLIGKLPIAQRKSLLEELPEWKKEEVKPLLAYPPDTAGGLMTNRIPIFHVDTSVRRVVDEYNVETKFGGYDTNHNIYVVDSQEKLVGIISVRDLLVTSRDKKIGEVVRKPTITVHPLLDQEEVARIMARYDLLELPVVDDKGKLLGAVTIDDVVDVVVEESDEKLKRFGGYVETVKSPYLTARISELVKKRAVWLIILCLLEAITVNILSNFESVISAIVALSFFIPLLDDVGGNVGSQSASFIIRSLATGDVTVYDVLKITIKESVVSLCLGLILSPIVFVLGFLISKNIEVPIILSVAIIAIVFVASIIGGLLPILAAKIKIDPATISAPLITTIADITGLTLYFTLASLFLLTS